MQKIALALTLLPLAACSSFSWHGQDARPDNRVTMADVTAMASQYDTETFFRDVRRRSDGRNNAFGRDLMQIQDFFDKYFWNYDKNDPTVNYPSDTTKLEHLGRFGLTTLTSVPGVDEIVTR